ncbi:MAG: KamA family radical SAM protein, partial [Proteobacteria bacterium]|nr:KamA family radical SAM protein [Pseudomonadota bacterium]
MPLTVCPMYCAYCTRSRLIGGSTASIDKTVYGPDLKKWQNVFNYLQHHPDVEDVVISGGDAYLLSPSNI